jgi:hypothetical protein
MKLVLSRCHPVADAQMPTGYFAREALFRTDAGSFLLYLASEGKTGCEERILFLDCREALVWLNATPDILGISSDTNSRWYEFTGSGIPSHPSKNVASLMSKEIRR